MGSNSFLEKLKSKIEEIIINIINKVIVFDLFIRTLKVS